MGSSDMKTALVLMEPCPKPARDGMNNIINTNSLANHHAGMRQNSRLNPLQNRANTPTLYQSLSPACDTIL
jgi:hypothetical protein